MGNSIVRYCYCRNSQSAEMTEHRRFLTNRCLYELLSAAVPVFLAAGVSNFVTSIIHLISESANDPEQAVILQAFVYAVLTSIFGKYFLYLIHMNMNEKSAGGSINHWLHKNKYTSLTSNFLIENAGFAWKEFLIIFLMEIVYVDYGFGAAFGAWLAWIGIYVLIIIISAWVISYFRHIPYHLRIELLSFHCEAFV